MSQINGFGIAGGGGTGPVLTLTGNSGGAVSPNGAGNINVVGDGTTITVVDNPGTNTLTISALSTGTVESVTGTVNQITASPTTGNVVLTIPTTFIAPGTITAANGNITATSGNFAANEIANDGNGPIYALFKSRSGGIIAPGDSLGEVQWYGFDGSGFDLSAQIKVTTSGTIGENQIPSTMQFYTHPNSVNVQPLLRMSISSTGSVAISTPDSGVGLTVSGGGLNAVGTIVLPSVYGGSVGATNAAVFIDSTGQLGTAGGGGGGVTSITGTANQITASASTGAVTLSTPSTFIGPGSVAATTNFLLPTSTASAGQLQINSVAFLHNVGTNNTFLGTGAGNTSTTSSDCVGIGTQALTGSTSGNSNTAVGYRVCQNASTYAECTGVGSSALGAALTGSYNTAIGSQAGSNLTSGIANSFLGRFCSQATTTGSNNVTVGYNAGQFVSGSNNVCVGYQAGTNYTGAESGNVIIGGAGTVGESNQTRIGYIGNAATQTGCFIDGISGVVAGTVPVLVAAGGQLGVAASSERFKENIKDMSSESDALLKMRPVTFNYKQDQSKSKSFGLIAEEVMRLLPEMVELDKEGRPFTVRYHEMPAMLLNELIKMNKRVEELERQLKFGKRHA